MVGSPEGRLYMNLYRQQRYGYGGSGDVLTGILARTFRQGMHAFDAACAGVYLPGMAGDRAAQKANTASLPAI